MPSAVIAAGATNGVGFPLLTCIVALPALGAAVLACLPRARGDLLKLVAVLFAVASGALSIWMLAEFDTAFDGFQFVSRHQWIESFGISWFLGVDGISLFLVVLSGVMFPIALVAASPKQDQKSFYAWMLLLMAGSMGAFVALDLLLFFVFFEIVLVPMYFLIGMWGYGNRVYAATKFFLFTMLGSALMLVGILALVILTSSNTGQGVTFDLVELAEAQGVGLVAARWIFVSFALAFAVKVPLFPVHTWLPDAHTEAPTAGSVILAAIMLKLGTYGFLRFGLYLFPEATHWFAPLFLTLGVVGIIYGAVVATMQRDLKRLVAYSSVAHLGFIVIGIFALNAQGLEGGVLQMVNHGLSTGALFILVGFIYERRHTREISELGGLQKSAPILAGVFTVVMLSSIGVPGLNGFVGEFLSLLGAFRGARWWGAVATLGVVLAAVYLLWAYQRVFHGSPEGENARLRDLSLREGLIMVPLVGLIVFIGVYPRPVLARIEPSVDALVAHVDAHVEDFEVEEIVFDPLPEGNDDAEHDEEGGED
ncbi:MAG: NADH-quinone oxidoreductase subunit M [Acidimicrobiales bacterium]|nr:MAG: NADH-quinone oxidoreductase subunit M [Actinomycetota bacterium]MBV6510319.1 NADH-quinone oxidoreductase subunit M [Acidimicrobiales bacterium]RIK07917.1 MAG: NADH-quinone oxidoreductase subunit M [Acidobacteriota bacterium]